MKVLAQDIALYDEILTMSTHVSVHSGMNKWRERYVKYAKKIDTSLVQAAELDPAIANFIEQTKSANERLIAIEEQVFSLMDQHKKEEAIALLDSNQYQAAKEDFILGLTHALNNVVYQADVDINKSRSRSGLYLLSAVLVCFALVMGLLLYLIQYIRFTDKAMLSLARVDSLSGLLNRRVFNENLVTEINRAHREKTILMLAVFDLDNFKLYNDTYGHPEGDKVIQEFGALLNDYSQRANESAYRIGGEEFAIISTHKDDSSGIERVQKIVERLHVKNIKHQTNAPYERVTVSGGVTFSTSEYGSADSLYEQADQALYRAKELGRNQISIFTEE